MPLNIPIVKFNWHANFKDLEEKEKEVTSIEEVYQYAETEFSEVVERCEDINTLYGGDDDEYTDEGAIKSVGKALADLDEIYLYKSDLEKRVAFLSKGTKATQRRLTYEAAWTKTKTTKDVFREKLEKIKKRMITMQKKAEVEQQQRQLELLRLQNAAQTAEATAAANRQQAVKDTDEKPKKAKARTDLAPDKLIPSPGNPGIFRTWKAAFEGYFDMSGFKNEPKKVQLLYLKKLVDEDLIGMLDLDIDMEYHMFPDQCREAGVDEKESLISQLEAVWIQRHPIHQNRSNLFKIRQEPSETYGQLTQRIKSHMKECDMEGLLKKEHLEGYLILNAIRNANIFQKVLREYNLKPNIMKKDIDSIALTEEGVELLSAGSAFDRLGPPVPPSNVNRIQNRGFSGNMQGVLGKISRLEGQAKMDAILEAKVCMHCLKKHPAPCNRKQLGIKCPKCGMGYHTEQACCYKEGEKLRIKQTRRGGVKRKASSSSNSAEAPPKKSE